MPELIFHPDVALEVKESYKWYQEQATGLGDDFIHELEDAYQAIIELPDTWPKFQGGFRSFLLSKFPFSVIYSSKQIPPYIIAIMHNSRKPNYWVNRI